MPSLVGPFSSFFKNRILGLACVALVGLVVFAHPSGTKAQEQSLDRIAEAPAASKTLTKGFLQDASIRYRVSHPLASYEGALDQRHIESSISFNEDAPEKVSGSVVVALLGFSSGNKARDKHARRSLNIESFPATSLELRGLEDVELMRVSDDEVTRLRGSCQAELVLHGHRSDWPVDVELEWSEDEVVVSSSFTVLLDDFSIRRDKLFGMPIRNEVPVTVELRYRRM